MYTPLSDVTPHALRHSFASVGNDLGFTEVTIAALAGHAKGSVTSKFIHSLDTVLIMAADTVAGYIEGLQDGKEFKQTAYALDRDSRKAPLAGFLGKATGDDDPRASEDQRRCVGQREGFVASAARHEGADVISLAPGTKVFLACRLVDLRNGFDGLAASTQ
jgi:hypothetical protein